MKFRLFSEREAAKKGTFPPAPRLKTFSTQLRRNITDILSETLGLYYFDSMGYGERVETTDLWIQLDRIMRREASEYADFTDKHRHLNHRNSILTYILNASHEGVLDALDVGVALVQTLALPLHNRSATYFDAWNIRLHAAEALAEIDVRLREHGTVYRVADGTIVNSTDDFAHEQIVVPAIRVLGEPGFENALHEFHESLEGYRRGQYDTVLAKSNHALESTMKIIAGKMGWPYDENASAAALVDVMMTNSLLPKMRDGATKTLASLLKSDLPPLRNKMPSAGHGSGEKAMVIPEQFATYAISASAANIRLLIESFKAKRKT